MCNIATILSLYEVMTKNHFRYIHVLGLFVVYILSCWNLKFKVGETDRFPLSPPLDITLYLYMYMYMLIIINMILFLFHVRCLLLHG